MGEITSDDRFTTTTPITVVMLVLVRDLKI